MSSNLVKCFRIPGTATGWRVPSWPRTSAWRTTSVTHSGTITVSSQLISGFHPAPREQKIVICWHSSSSAIFKILFYVFNPLSDSSAACAWHCLFFLVYIVHAVVWHKISREKNSPLAVGYMMMLLWAGLQGGHGLGQLLQRAHQRGALRRVSRVRKQVQKSWRGGTMLKLWPLHVTKPFDWGKKERTCAKGCSHV